MGTTMKDHAKALYASFPGDPWRRRDTRRARHPWECRSKDSSTDSVRRLA